MAQHPLGAYKRSLPEPQTQDTSECWLQGGALYGSVHAGIQTASGLCGQLGLPHALVFLGGHVEMF